MGARAGRGLLRAAGVSLDLLFRALGLLAGLAEAWQPPAAAAWSVALGMLGALCWLAPAGLPLRALGAALLLPALLPSSPPVEWGGRKCGCWTSARGWPCWCVPGSVPCSMTAVRGRGVRHGRAGGGAGAAQPGPAAPGRPVAEPCRQRPCRRCSYGRFPIPAGLAGQRRTRAPAFAVVRGQLRRAELVLGWRGFRTVGMGTGRRQQRPLLCAEGRGRWRSPAADRDISRAAEHAWLARQADPRVDWLLAPHHGSRSSSGVAFVLRTRPRHVLVSRGWRNAFGHPHGEVMERYARVAAQVHDTARDGALTFLLGSRGGARRERDSAHFWREK